MNCVENYKKTLGALFCFFTSSFCFANEIAITPGGKVQVEDSVVSCAGKVTFGVSTISAGEKIQIGNVSVSCIKEESFGFKFLCGSCYQTHFSEPGHEEWHFDFLKITRLTGREQTLHSYDCLEVLGSSRCKKKTGGRTNHISSTGFNSRSDCESGRSQTSACQ